MRNYYAVREFLSICTESMRLGQAVTLVCTSKSQNHTGIVQSIAREDGSGLCYIVTMHNKDQFFVRCSALQSKTFREFPTCFAE